MRRVLITATAFVTLMGVTIAISDGSAPGAVALLGLAGVTGVTGSRRSRP